MQGRGVPRSPRLGHSAHAQHQAYVSEASKSCSVALPPLARRAAVTSAEAASSSTDLTALLSCMAARWQESERGGQGQGGRGIACAVWCL